MIRLSFQAFTTGLVICFSLSSSNVFGQLVLYDGALGDADPVTQGWDLTLNPLVASVTPDPVNDYVTMIAAQLGHPAVFYDLPHNLPSLQTEVGDDSYQWKLKFQLVEFLFMGFPTGISQHELNEFFLYTGFNSGSAGYLDRLFIEDTGFRFVDTGGKAHFRLDFAFVKSPQLPTNVFGQPPEFDISPNWNNMLDMNELTYNRIGNRAEVFMNGDFIMSGYTSSVSNNATQLSLRSSGGNRTEMNWARFEVGPAQPLVLPNPPSSHTLYDGSYFGGDPIKQGWLVEPLSPGLTLTPNAINDSVKIQNSAAKFRFKTSPRVRKTEDETEDDYYKWTMEFSVDPISHEAAIVDLVGGEYRESFLIEDDHIRVLVVGTTTPLQAAAGFDLILTPGETPNFTSMSDVNELSMFRKGEEVFITINGDIVFRGVGGEEDQSGAGQLAISSNFDEFGFLDTDLDLYSFSISSPLEGDYDADGDVDNDDYAVWVANFGAVLPFNPSPALFQIDGNQDHVINAADYTIWRDNLGATAPFLGLTVPLIDTASNSVPEPNTSLLACFAIVGGMSLRRQKLSILGQ